MKSTATFLFFHIYIGMAAQPPSAISDKGTKTPINWSLNGTNIHNNNTGNVGVGTDTPNSTLEIDSQVSGTSGLQFTQINNTSPISDAQPVGVDATGNVVVTDRATLTDNGDGTLTFSNASGTADDVVINTEPTTENTVVTSALWLDTSSITITNNTFTQSKTFVIPGGTLGTQNAVRIICYRIKGAGNQRFRLDFGGQTFYESGNLGTQSSRTEFIIFANGATGAQKSFMDDANTGANGQRFGTVSVDSTVDQTVEIFLRNTNATDTSFLDISYAEVLNIGN